MHAHVTTHRLGSQAEVEADVAAAAWRTGPISDQTARTIASWWHSPADTCRNITSLSHGIPFDTVGLAEEIRREITDELDAKVLLEWLEHLETLGDSP